MVMAMKIIAHRGNDMIHKENTKEAILNSLDYEYIDGVEFDVRMTKDYKFVIHHDPFYNGKLINITKCKKLKGISHLDEVLKNIHSQKIIMIDIKQPLVNKHYEYYLYRQLKKYNLNYYICSFNYNFVNKFAEKHPEINVGVIIGIKEHMINSLSFNSVYHKYIDIITEKETFVWTVNTKEVFEKIPFRCNIITDKAKYISSMLKNN